MWLFPFNYEASLIFFCETVFIWKCFYVFWNCVFIDAEYYSDVCSDSSHVECTLIYRDLYQTEIFGINYGNRQLSFDGQSKVGKVVFDSGSSYTYFPKEAYLDLVASVSFYIYQSGTIL